MILLIYIRRFLNCLVPIYKCNLKCTYCYLAQRGTKNQDIEEFSHSPQIIAEALAPKRVGGICLVNLCASGETLLSAKTVELIKLLLKDGHYVSVVTNNTISKHIKMLTELQGIERLFLKCSFHYIQLKKYGLLNDFFDNIDRLRNAGISYTIELVADDNAAIMYDEICRLMKEKGEALPQILECRVDPSNDIRRLTLDQYHHKEFWSKYNSDLYNAQQQLWGLKINKFCYAGDLSAEINLETGEVTQCIGTRVIQNIYSETDHLRFCAIGNNCKLSHCFISYAWQGLCGNVPEIIYPNYAKLRNRYRPDGSEWLTSTIKDAFGKKCIEAIKTYSDEKKRLCDLMFKLYHGENILLSEDDTIIIISAVKMIAGENNKIMIYGYGAIGQLLLLLLQDKYEIVVADRKAERINNGNNKSNYKCLNSDECLEHQWSHKDYVVLITTFIDAESIKQHMKNVYKKVYTITDIIDMTN